ncbi:MAG: archease [Pseudomonadota bacterium]
MVFEQIDHTADVGLKIIADSAAALFSEAARGMFSLIVSGPASGVTETREIRIQADDWEGLLVAWLRELLYLWHSENRWFCQVVHATVTAHAVSATVKVDRFDPAIHVICSEIKAVTYHQIAVGTDGRQWTARVIFDA